MDNSQFKTSIGLSQHADKEIQKFRPSSTYLDKLITSQLAVQKSMAEAKAVLENNLIIGLASNNSSMIYKYIHRRSKKQQFASSRSVLRQY